MSTLEKEVMLKNSGESGTPQRWRVLWSTWVAYLFDSYDLAILAVVMPFLLAELSIDKAQGGLLQSATMTGAVLGSILFGLIAENVGRKHAIIGCLLTFGIGTVAVFFVDSWGFWMAIRFLTGLGIGGIWGPCVATIAKHWYPKHFARANSFMLSTFAVGWIVSSLVARVFLAEGGNWKIMFGIGAFAVPVAIILVFTLPKEEKIVAKLPKEKTNVSFADLFAKDIRRNTIFAYLQAFCLQAGSWSAFTWIPTFMVQERGLVPIKMATFTLSIYIGMFVGYQVFGMVADYLGRKKALLIAFLSNAILIPVFLFVKDLSILWVVGAAMGIAFGGCIGLQGAFLSELFPAKIKALAGGFCFNGARIGAIAAPFTVGVYAQTYGLQYAIIISPVVFALGFLFILCLPETLKKEAE